MVKSTHTIKKVWEPISQAFPIREVLLPVPWYGKSMRKHICISHMMKYTRGWESNGKNTHTMETVWEPISEAFPIRWVLLSFPYNGKLMRKSMHFPYDEVYHRMEIEYEKSTHTMGKVWVPISQFLLVQWVLLHFPVLWEINGETQAFPIWLSIP